MKRTGILIYGVISYFAFFGSFLYLIGFTGNLIVPKGIDGELVVPLWQAVLTNVSLILLFGVQHSIMARAWFKEWWLKMIPEAMERSTFVLFSSLALVIMFYFWQPLGGIVWEIESPFIVGILWATFALGYALVFISSFLINHFDLFGLRQVWLNFRRKPYTHLAFGTPFLYKIVRHPLYFGILLAFWSAGTMSVTRFLFATVFTIYTLKAIQWEEKDLMTHFGDLYRKYAEQVPMIIPSFFNKRSKEPVYKSIAKKNEQEMI